jgi:hypothetical protein
MNMSELEKHLENSIKYNNQVIEELRKNSDNCKIISHLTKRVREIEERLLEIKQTK